MELNALLLDNQTLYIQQAEVSPGCLLSHLLAQLYGFMVEDQSGKRKLFYCDSEEDRDGWYWYFQNQATKQACPSSAGSSARCCCVPVVPCTC